MTKTFLLAAAVSLSLILTSCKKTSLPEMISKEKTSKSENNGEGEPAVINYSNHCIPVVSNFYAGQHILAGTITVTNDANNIYITFTTTGGWTMGQTHLYVGLLAGLPVNKKGNPQIGNFPYKTTHTPRVTSYSYSIPISVAHDAQCVIIAAHAEVFLVGDNGEVKDSQTAWASGKQMVNSGSWASYFDYCLCNDTDSGDDGEGGDGSGGTDPGGDGSDTTDTGGGNG